MRWLAGLVLSAAAVQDSHASAGPLLSRSRGSVGHLETTPATSRHARPLELSFLQRAPFVVEDPGSKCETVLLTTFFTSRPDPQRGGRQSPHFSYMSNYYNSVLSVPGGHVRSIVFHDGLPSSLTERYKSDRISFERVDLYSYDPEHRAGLNDIRFWVYLDQLKAHPEWETVFMTDISDVTVVHNPCALVSQAPTKLFVGEEPTDPAKNGWMKDQFAKMGGKYYAWYMDLEPGTRKLLNAGVLGGRHDVVLNFLEHIVPVLKDPELPERRRHQGMVTADMPALNWVLANDFSQSDVVSGHPINSVFKEYQRGRRDVYFIHKFL